MIPAIVFCKLFAFDDECKQVFSEEEIDDFISIDTDNGGAA